MSEVIGERNHRAFRDGAGRCEASRGRIVSVQSHGFVVARPLVFVVAILLSSQLLGLYATMDLRDVPLSRLVENMTARLRESPNDFSTAHRLGRLYAMAFATDLTADSKVTIIGGVPNWESTGEFRFSSRDQHFPFRGGANVLRNDEAGPEETTENANPQEADLEPGRHLDRAIEFYEKSIALFQARNDGLDATERPEQLGAIQLGLAWCLRQRALRSDRRGEDSARAANLLREIVDRVAPRELKAQYSGLMPYLSHEAGHDLLETLVSGDVPQSTPSEIADLRRTIEAIDALPRAMTPLAVDLGRAEGPRPGVLIDAKAAVEFDLDGSGLRRPWNWITPNAAWIAWMPEGAESIESALQLFGNRTFNLFLADGFQALGLLDDDGDGELRDAELAGLVLWRDADMDGVSQPNEITSFAGFGVESVVVSSERDASGLLVARAGLKLGDGETLDVWDLVLDSAPWTSTRRMYRPVDSSWQRLDPLERVSIQ